MFVFLVLKLVLMRLCLCLFAIENSIRQIGGFLLIFLFILLTLMSRVFSFVTLMLFLCAYALVDLSLSGVHTFVNFLTVVGFTIFLSFR